VARPAVLALPSLNDRKGNDMNDKENMTDAQKTDLPATEAREDNAGANNKMMLIFGGAMAVCCLLPLLLASGFSLAWLSGSPIVAAVLAAAIALLGWRLTRKPSSCGNRNQAADKSSAPN
jgi:hypothetical protein